MNAVWRTVEAWATTHPLHYWLACLEIGALLALALVAAGR